MTLGNMQFIQNEIDELTANCKLLHEYRERAFIGLSEIWLQENDPTSTFDIDRFKLVRSDGKGLSKWRGAGVGAYINDEWCSQVTL